MSLTAGCLPQASPQGLNSNKSGVQSQKTPLNPAGLGQNLTQISGEANYTQYLLYYCKHFLLSACIKQCKHCHF